MQTDSTHTELLIEEKSSATRKLVALASALLITALVFAGYAYLRKRHNQQVAARGGEAQVTTQSVPKGPAKAHIVVDEALLKGGQTVIGGTVRNISSEKLTGLFVGLELRRRKDASIEETRASVDPPDLEPQQEGRYVLKLPAKEYSSVRLLGLKGGLNSSVLAYTTSQGQKRPPERLEPKIVTVPRSGGRRGQFLNSPDNPARVP